MRKINIRESLNQLDKETFAQYDLSHLYECCNLKDDEKCQLVKYIANHDDPKLIGEYLEERLPDYVTDDDDIDDLKFIDMSKEAYLHGGDDYGFDEYDIIDHYDDLEDGYDDEELASGFGGDRNKCPKCGSSNYHDGHCYACNPDYIPDEIDEAVSKTLKEAFNDNDLVQDGYDKDSDEDIQFLDDILNSLNAWAEPSTQSGSGIITFRKTSDDSEIAEIDYQEHEDRITTIWDSAIEEGWTYKQLREAIKSYYTDLLISENDQRKAAGRMPVEDYWAISDKLDGFGYSSYQIDDKNRVVRVATHRIEQLAKELAEKLPSLGATSVIRFFSSVDEYTKHGEAVVEFEMPKDEFNAEGHKRIKDFASELVNNYGFKRTESGDGIYFISSSGYKSDADYNPNKWLVRVVVGSGTASSYKDIPAYDILKDDFTKDKLQELTEAFEKSGGPFWYFTKHGVQPGAVPKDIQILDIIDCADGSGAYFKSDKVLTTKELNDFEIVERKPQGLEEDWRTGTFTEDDFNKYVEKMKSDAHRLSDSIQYMINKHPEYADLLDNLVSEIVDIFSSSYMNESFEEDAEEDGLETADQKISSAATSINSSKLPAIFRMVKFQPDTMNLDYGGGRFDNAAEELSKINVTNLVYDPYNRSAEHNQNVIKQVKENGGADTVTISNVLNVIAEPSARRAVLRNAKKLVKPTGKIYITVYEGNKSGEGAETKSGYQLNKDTKDYLDEVSEVFDNVTRKGKLIIAN